MNTYGRSGPSSAVASISDLDGYSFPNHVYVPADDDEFGFDPPAQKTLYPKMAQTNSPIEDDAPSSSEDWPGFERDDDRRLQAGPMYQLKKWATQKLPQSAAAVTRFGQVTPPRTNSAGSVETLKQEDSVSPRTSTSSSKRKNPKQNKEPAAQAPSTSGRKRKNGRKSAPNAESTYGNIEDSKRKASLEKNRLAAAKCRINKKEKTDILQRDSHDKAIHNAYLKEQVMRMKEEVQQLNALLLAHASCDGCKSPEEIQKHLQELSAEYMPRQMSIGGFPDYDEMSLDGMNQPSDGSYFATAPPNGAMLNPPLPEFNRTADFEVHTPMHTD